MLALGLNREQFSEKKPTCKLIPTSIGGGASVASTHLKHSAFDLGEIPTNQERQEGVVGGVDRNTQCRDVDK